MKTPLKRIVVYLFEIAGALAICLLVGLSVLMARLEKGPLTLKNVIPEIEEVINGWSPGLKFQIGDANLESAEARRAMRVRLNNVRILNSDGQLVGSLKTIALGFNWRNLSDFTIMPVALEIADPAAQITKFSNGYVGFNFQDVNPDKKPASITDISNLLSRVPRSIRFARITGVELRYVDETDQSTIALHNGLFEFSRREDNLSGTMSVDVEAKNFKQRINGTISHDPDEDDAKITVALKDFKLDQIRDLVTLPEKLKLTMPMNVLLTANIGTQLQINNIDLQIAGKKGSLQFEPYFPEAVPLDGMLANAHYFPDQQRLQLQNMALKIDEATVLAKGNVTRKVHVDDATKFDTIVDVQALTENVPVDKLKDYWPHELGHHARDWVVNRLTVGTAEQAVIDLGLTIDADKNLSIDKMQGNIKYKNITVNYLPPMPVVTGVTGHIKYNKEFFDIYANDGLLFDTKLTDAFIRIDDLIGTNQHIKLDLKMSGPVHDAMVTISSKPLEYAQKLGLVPDSFGGTGDTRLELYFPLLSDLKLDQVEMITSAKLHNITAKKVIKDLNVSAKAMDLNINTKQLALEGDAEIMGSPAHVVWNEYFTGAEKYSTILDAKGMVTPAIIKALHVPVDQYFKGSVNSTAHIARTSAGLTEITVKGELANSEVIIPELAIQKKTGVAGLLNLNVAIDKVGTTISNSSLSWNGFKIPNASMKFSDANGLESATIKDMQFGRSRTDIVVTPIAGGMKASVTGDTVDLSDYWAKPGDPNAKPSNRNLDLTLKLKTLYLNKDVPINNMQGNIVLKGKQIQRGRMSGITDQNGSFALQQTQNRDGSRRLAVKAFNVGRVAQALDITHGLKGGTLTVVGNSTPKEPSVIIGNARLEKFSLVNAPIMARLLNALSPGGLLNLLKTNGLNFSVMESKFTLPDAETVKLSKGKMTGDSLGLSFSGNVDLKMHTLAINGTIIPIEGINKLANKIPVLGTILTGINGNGIIGATYKIRGPSDNPSVSVNPLSALAPGILRSIFFESSDN